jgi:hypothetical protein
LNSTPPARAKPVFMNSENVTNEQIRFCMPLQRVSIVRYSASTDFLHVIQLKRDGIAALRTESRNEEFQDTLLGE